MLGRTPWAELAYATKRRWSSPAAQKDFGGSFRLEQKTEPLVNVLIHNSMAWRKGLSLVSSKAWMVWNGGLLEHLVGGKVCLDGRWWISSVPLPPLSPW